MKKLTILAVGLAMLGLGACNNKEKDQKLQDAETRNIELEGDVNELVATQDSLLMLVNDITEGMNQIKELERIISSPAALQNESPRARSRLKTILSQYRMLSRSVVSVLISLKRNSMIPIASSASRRLKTLLSKRLSLRSRLR